MNDKMI